MSSCLQLTNKKKHMLLAESPFSVEEAKDFAADILPPGLLMVHDPSRCCEHDVTKLQVVSRRKLVT
jgi:hypothetical protein